MVQCAKSNAIFGFGVNTSPTFSWVEFKSKICPIEKNAVLNSTTARCEQHVEKRLIVLCRIQVLSY
jgi:hypothetical protein